MSLELVEDGCSGEVVSEEVKATPTYQAILETDLLEEIGAESIYEIVEAIDGFSEKITKVLDNYVTTVGVIPENLGYAIAALDDFSGFMQSIAEGKEVFHTPPPKIELSAEDVAITHDYVITLPTKLDDLRYMGEWFNKFFFPNTRPLIKTEGEMSVEGFGNKDTGEVEGVSFWFIPKEGTPFEVMSKLAGTQINLVEFANTIDTHVAE